MVLADPIAGKLVQELNPGFKAPARPFKRLDYKDAIAFLNEHDILVQDDDPAVPARPHQIGDDIAEAAERKMTDMLNVPIFLMNFPKHLKSFYMKKIEGDEEFTESVDVLMPNVGEIVGQSMRSEVSIQRARKLTCTVSTGGSMRISDIDELMEGYKREGIPADPYYWFTDQRKYGTSEHGGYGLGVEVSCFFFRMRVNKCPLCRFYSYHISLLVAIPRLVDQPMDCTRMPVVWTMAGPCSALDVRTFVGKSGGQVRSRFRGVYRDRYNAILLYICNMIRRSFRREC
jgi:asparaginyl-tRNA synthetase